MGEVRTELLGQFTDDNAAVLLARLEEQGVVCWTKRSGSLARLLFADDWGTRVFVDAARRAEAEAIAREVLAEAKDGG